MQDLCAEFEEELDDKMKDQWDYKERMEPMIEDLGKRIELG